MPKYRRVPGLRSMTAVAAALLCPWASAQLHPPYEQEAARPSRNPIDALVAEAHERHGVTPAPLCSDAVFVRRAYLDVIGALPTPQEVTAFLRDQRPRKRERLVETLLNRPEFADYWAMKWADALRIKAEYPIKLWPNAVQAYHRWVRGAVRENMPYDDFARALLTSSGSNFRVAPVNFYRAVQGKSPEALASAVALTFMGVRLETWPEEERLQLAAFFSRVAFKPTAEWKEEIVYNDPAAEGPLEATLPGGRPVTVPAGEDPRVVFADWLLAEDNPHFARAAVNRVWFWLLGRGIVHEPDDMGPHNPPAIPALLSFLAEALRQADYDLRPIYKLILTSHAYQRSSIPRGDLDKAETYFACYPVRRLDAEVLQDAVNALFGGPGEEYESRIPEPFTYTPHHERTVALADGSITSPFLAMFGRPSRDTGLASERSNASTEAQRLYLLNSTELHQKMARSARLRALANRAPQKPDEVIQTLYLLFLSRLPTPEERAAIYAYADEHGADAFGDAVWSLVNSKEFLYRH